MPLTTITTFDADLHITDGTIKSTKVDDTVAWIFENNLGINKAVPAKSLDILGGSARLAALATPSAPSVANIGTTGSTTYSYYIVAKDRNGGKTLVSPVGTTTTGHATLDTNNYNQITWTAVTGAYSYDVLKTNTSTSIALDVQALTYNDQGGATSAYVNPTANTTADFTIDGTINVGTLTLSGDLVVPGNLTVSGTTTTVNSTTVDVADRVIHVNNSTGANDPVPSLITGLAVHRGAITGTPRDHAAIIWDEGNSRWIFSLSQADDSGLVATSEQNLRAAAITAIGNFDVNTNKFTVNATTGNTVAGGTLTSTGNFDVNTNKFTVNATSGNTLVAGTLDATGNFAVNTNKFTANATTGNTVAGGTLTSTGNFDVNTNKFTVNATSGNTVAGGTLTSTGNFDVNTNKFTVSATTGNTIVAGTLDVTGNVAVNTNKFTVNATTGATLVAGILTTQAGQVRFTRTATTTPVTVATSDDIINIDLGTPAAVTVNLPAAPATGTTFVIKDGKGDAATNNITIDPNGADTIDGLSTYVIDSGYGSAIIYWNGTEWKVLANRGRRVYTSFIYDAVNGTTTLAKPGGAPDIPDNELTEVYIDGRKVFRGASRNYTVDSNGDGITFASLRPHQTVELRYWA